MTNEDVRFACVEFDTEGNLTSTSKTSCKNLLQDVKEVERDLLEKLKIFQEDRRYLESLLK